MKKQCLVAIGRESGSGGRVIGEGLAARLGIKLYDNSIIEELSKFSGYDKELIEKHDEKPVNTFLSSTIRGYSNSIEENVALKQFEFLKARAEEGESFVVVGRCGEYVLREFPCLTSIFVIGTPEGKVRRSAAYYGVSPEQAEILNRKIDKQRKIYHNHYCNFRWGEPKYYDLTVKSGVISDEKLIEVLYQYILMKNGE